MIYNPLEDTSVEAKNTRESVGGCPGKIDEDFNAENMYWRRRVDGFAQILLHDSIIELSMGPTEALYYSNAEVSDAGFNDLCWRINEAEFKARLTGDHYGSAGFGYWNHSMLLNRSFPAWFIYLRAASAKYPLNGFFAQYRGVFIPIKWFHPPPLGVRLALRLTPFLVPIRIIGFKPRMQNLDLHDWHVYRIIGGEGNVVFEIDGETIGSVKRGDEPAMRIDMWIDNSVFTPMKGDYALVYRHVTHENPGPNSLLVDYVRVK